MFRYCQTRWPDIVAGLSVALVGVFILIESAGYSMGSLRQMGPGFFPRALGIGLVLLGLAIASPLAAPVGLTGNEADKVQPVAFILLIAAFSAFALLIESRGLIPAIAVTVVLAALADPGMRRRPLAVLGLAAATAVACYLIFRLGLGLQMVPFK